MHDEEMVGLARAGNRNAAEFLISRYRPLVESKARSYFVIGADREDVIQEGMIGLFKAIRDFRDDRANKFRPFAELCVTRQIITAVKTATRQKHGPLNAYVSLTRPYSGDSVDSPLLDVLSAEGPPDQETAVFGHRVPPDTYEALAKTLSPLEHSVLRHYLSGMSYRDMGSALSCQAKSIDNALQRVKRKIGAVLKDWWSNEANIASKLPVSARDL